MCGEYGLAHQNGKLEGGSSPRVWGIRCSRLVRRVQSAVHPHVCGEYGFEADGLSFPRGSSPRVWGIQNRTRLPMNGSTVHPHVCGEYGYSSRSIPPTRAVHPHVCGEYGLAVTGYSHAEPVHPHVCGEYVRILKRRYAEERFIPTCVGNTGTKESLTAIAYGSSPRVWGILQRRRRR